MGRASRDLPKYLPSKLLQIREALALTQGEMLEHLGNPKHLLQTSISRFERGTAQPPLQVLLRYAQLANVTVDALIDDAVALPTRLPSPKRSDGVSRKTD